MHFEFEQVIALPRATVFAFHEDPEHLVVLHRGWAAFRLIHHDGHLHQGSRTWFEITLARTLPVAMGFEHTIYEPPHRFGERLIHGPFSKFTHLHEFDEVFNKVGAGASTETNAETRVRDLLDVELPWHYGGEVAMKAFIAPMLQRAFKFRQRTLLQLAQAGEIGQRAGQQIA
jgi:ligand-binding SRPBCC domain-containing protein